MSAASVDPLIRLINSSSRARVANDRAWQLILTEKTKQVAELEQVMREILSVCAQAQGDLVHVDDLYRVMSGVRQD